MTLTIPDDILRLSGLSERDAVLELACWLFDIERLDLTAAGRLAGLDRVHMEIELRRRSIPVWRPTVADIAQDAVAIKRLRTSP